MASISKQKFTGYIKQFDFTTLFNELGWDHEKKGNSCIIDGLEFRYKLVASLKGYYIITLGFEESEIPKEPTRKKISVKISQTYPESLVIFHGEKTQYWAYRVQMETGKEKYSETNFVTDKEADALYQRAAGLFFDIDEMDNVAFVDVKAKVRKLFSVNYDTVTKKFYDSFKKEHTSFKEAIGGITNDSDLDWYASVTLNRLMFCYFIQKKGFLDNDTNYLKNKLNHFIELEDEKGFFSFYKDFLIVLFHSGLGALERDEEKRQLLGNIPYLNGGMFEVHELEQQYDAINIANTAFARIFNFFDQYKWHLDINPDAPGNEINPDVLGYIFEKYINQRAEMGAYYTKEDITGYIGKNTIIPFLFDEVKRHYPKPFEADGEVWVLMQKSGDGYIYPSIKYGLPVKAGETLGDEGLFDDLPEEIQIGLDPEQKDLWIIRKPWNKPAPPNIALPTEIYREVIERRTRYKDLNSKIKTGGISEINDLITNNLDIIGFTHDILSETQDVKLLENFYKAIVKVTILDPTCGSGAFLFAAMNILEPLYEILIERMRALVSDEERTNVENYNKGRLLYSDKFRFFKDVLSGISGLKNPDDPESGNKHPNQKYFIFKSIILNNLYGVDIMKEAVEIAKLRLFLKLVAQVHPDPNAENLGIEPLPDMDFNIKCGNTLVGFATKRDIENISSLLLDENLKNEIYDECEKISLAFEHFKKEQLSGGETTLLKLDLKERISQLNENLNLLLYKAHYGGGVYNSWRTSHQPFHWFAEFYEILERKGGFDVIIGNPPYVENNKALKTYKVNGYRTVDCGNIYAMILERVYSIINHHGSKGWIVPISVISTDRTGSLQKLLLRSDIKYSSSFDVFPSRLFEGAAQRLNILIIRKNEIARLFTSTYHRWFQKEREILLQKNNFFENTASLEIGWIPRMNSILESEILKKLDSISLLGERLLKTNETEIFVHRIINNFVKALNFEPYFRESNGTVKHSDDFKIIKSKKDEQLPIIGLLNSNLFYWYWRLHGDGFHCGFKDINRFPISARQIKELMNPNYEKSVINLIEDLTNNSEIRERNQQKTGKILLQTFFVSKSKNLLDNIDAHLCQVFGLSELEVDYIINFNIKYRISNDLIEI